MIDDWVVPEGLVGERRLLRVTASDVRANLHQCADQAAAKARPALAPRTRSWRGGGLELFALGVVGAVLDLVEFEDVPLADAVEEVERKRDGVALHPALIRWVGHAAARWLDASRRLEEGSGLGLESFRREWVVQHRYDDGTSSSVSEVTAWGRRYCSPDGGVRELRLMRATSVVDRIRDDGEISTALFVLAKGRATRGETRNGLPRVVTDQPPRARRLRVVEVGCLDGSSRVLADVDPEGGVRRYREHGRTGAQIVLRGGSRQPGNACVKCKILTGAGCGALPRADGILGIDGPRRERRMWSVSNGRAYQRCPAQEYLRRINLPREEAIEYGPAARRGQAVHAWVEHQHKRGPGRPCHASDVPDGDSWSAGGWRVTGEQAHLGIQMVGDHATVCPFQHLGSGARVESERSVTAFDAAANIVVTAKLDLLYHDNDALVMRELKTTSQVGEGDPLARYPQLALGVLLFAHGVLGDTSTQGRVELERLTPAGAFVDMFDPADPDHVAKARRVVNDLARDWHGDTRAASRPGRHCAQCEVARWCPDAHAAAAGAVR